MPDGHPDRDRPVLIAGFGSVGRRHFRNLQELGYRRFLFLRSGRGTLDDTEIAGHHSSSNIAELLRERPFAAVIATPSGLHVPVAQAAAEAGCHLFIEKPVSHNLDGCERLVETCRSKSLVTFVGCQFRFHPLFGELRDSIRDGRIGTVVGARAESGDYLPGWHPWEDHRRSYAARSDLGGGVVLTWIHPFDYLHDLFGPGSVSAATLRSIPSLETGCEDWAEITLGHDSGVVSQIHLDYLQRPPVHHLTVWGDRGRGVLDFADGTLRWTDAEGRCDERTVPAGFDRNSLFVAELRHFLECIAENRPSRIPLEEGLAVLKLALDAKRSAMGVAS